MRIYKVIGAGAAGAPGNNFTGGQGGNTLLGQQTIMFM
jgi:hypothetical protein